MVGGREYRNTGLYNIVGGITFGRLEGFSSSEPCIIVFMFIPDRIISELELCKYTGERSTRKYIAYHGIVYDVTDCPKWRKELHEQLHFPGQDLTSEFPDAPHKEEVFKHDCVTIVGRFKEHG